MQLWRARTSQQQLVAHVAFVAGTRGPAPFNRQRIQARKASYPNLASGRSKAHRGRNTSGRIE
jgi:hypothetical protein